jgi:endonuclease/exonuclease/phosphatase (EEP) superfamily protein YafD
MSWNVRRLWGGEQDGGDPAGCVVQAIRKADPDVVDLLEVSAEDVAKLGTALDLDCAHTPYFRGGGPKTGGAAVCAKKGRWNLKKGSGQRFVDTDDWSYLFAELEREGAVINLLAVHLVPYRVTERDLRRTMSDLWSGKAETALDLGDRSERAIRSQADQSAALVDRVSRLKDPTVIAGDFNSTRDTALHVALRKHLTDTYERAGGGFGGTIRVLGALPLRVDFIYSTPAIYVADSEIPACDCSDHRPVVTRLVVPK